MLNNMSKKKRRGFTLIELVAVLVIMAILAVDAYGRSIELAIAGYLLDNGKFPTDVNQLSIEYSGDEVVCETTQINTDSSVYLAGCSVAGRSVEGYTYGSEEIVTYDAYQVGDHVSYNGVTYYVIEDSDTTNDTVKLLKENALSLAEMRNLNLSDVYIGSEYATQGIIYGISNDYSTSTAKKVVDAWSETTVKNGDYAVIRMITLDDLYALGYDNVVTDCCGGCGQCLSYSPTNKVPSWLYNTGYSYWTSTAQNSTSVWSIGSNGNVSNSSISYKMYVRPVLELNKSADITKLAS